MRVVSGSLNNLGAIRCAAWLKERENRVYDLSGYSHVTVDVSLVTQDSHFMALDLWVNVIIFGAICSCRHSIYSC